MLRRYFMDLDSFFLLGKELKIMVLKHYTINKFGMSRQVGQISQE